MIDDFQKEMIKNAFDQDPKIVKQICAIADMMGDDDTVEYIAENYMYLFNEEEKKGINMTLAEIKMRRSQNSPSSDNLQ